MKNLKKIVASLPTTPGVYFFSDQSGKIIYIGKAASLKERVSSYFRKNLNYERPIEFVIEKIKNITTISTNTVIEAYFLEQKLIKKYQPKYNTLGKDDKSFCYLAITKEKFSRFEIIRQTDLEDKKTSFKKIYGPYSSKKNLELALKILQKIFPYHNRKELSEKKCLDFQIGLCPGPYAGKINARDYQRNIKSIELFVQGKKMNLITDLEKKMKFFAKQKNFEKATILRDQLFALRHLQDIAFISNQESDSINFENIKSKNSIFRIEGYDISNLAGKYFVGGMVVFDNKNGTMEPNKKQYRKFKIKDKKINNDLEAVKEMLCRRLKNDWPLPDLMIIDGGKIHLEMTKKTLISFKVNLPIIAVAKGPNRKKLDLYTFGKIPRIKKNLIAQVRDEAHRFAISYHRKVRKRAFLKKQGG